MKTKLLASLVISALLLARLDAAAQTFTNLHTFSPVPTNQPAYPLTNSDGGNSYAAMILSGDTLYGTTSDYNGSGLGGIFKINTDGSGFSNLFSFSFITSNLVNGSNPNGALTLSGDVLYGVTANGGSNFTGSIYSIQTDGAAFTNLHGFSKVVSTTNAEGQMPEGPLVLAGGVLYGVAYEGGAHGDGAIFAINTDGAGFTNLWSFNGANGENPYAPLVLSGGMLYGTTYLGGANSNGTIFAISTNGDNFVSYHDFGPLGYPYMTNIDGAHPHAGMTLSGDTLYGTTATGGTNGQGYGTVFAINTSGAGFTSIYSFNATEGDVPFSVLCLSGSALYGTTTGGGAHSGGMVFKLDVSGSDFVDLYDFPLAVYSRSAYTNATGAEPWGGVVLAGDAIFGATPTGGTNGLGTLYSITVGGSAPGPVPLNVQTTSGSVVLTWSGAGSVLQSTADLNAAFADMPSATSPYALSPTNSQQFFRLRGASTP